MSLSYELGKIKNWETITRIIVDGLPQMNPVTQALIWLGIPCGYGEITDKNKVIIFKRIRFYETVRGAFNNEIKDDVRTPCFVTYKQVVDHIGLSLNITMETEPAFQKKIVKNILSDVNYDAFKEIQAYEQENK